MRIQIGIDCRALAAPIAAAFLAASTAAAQIATDGSVGQRTTIPNSGSEIARHFKIPASLGSRPAGGANLFHSFGSFDVPVDAVAEFTADGLNGPVDRVIARVTGGRASEIDGILRSSVGQREFIFVNPFGVHFGGTSVLDVGSSFHVSTADEIVFADGVRLPTDRVARPVLTTAQPVAFGFLTDVPAGVDSRGLLEVPRGERLSIVGGTITIRGEGARSSEGSSGPGVVSAPEGEVLLVSLASRGTVRGLFERGRAPDVDAIQRGEIRILDDGIVSASGISPTYRPDGNGAKKPPEFLNKPYFNADRIDGPAGGEWPEQFRLATHSLTPQNGAVVLGIDPDDPDRAFYYLNRIAGSEGLNDRGSGSIWIRGGSLEIEDSDIRSLAPGSSRSPGTINVEISGDVNIERMDRKTDVGILARTGVPVVGGVSFIKRVGGEIIEIDFAPGTDTPDEGPPRQFSLLLAGDAPGASVHVDARNVIVSGGARIAASSRSAGQGGDIHILASESVRLIGINDDALRTPSGIFNNAEGTGDAGSIRVHAPLLRLEKAGAIIAATTGNASAGDIGISVARLQVLDGSQIDGSTGAPPGTDPDTTGGQGGRIDVVAGLSALISGRGIGSDFSRISSFSEVTSTGRAGDIRVTSPLLELRDGGGISVTTHGAGNGGSVEVTAGRVRLLGGASLAARSEGLAAGAGMAGSIRVVGAREIVLEDSFIATSAANASGGNIELQAVDLVNLLRSEITTSVRGGSGPGGDITIDPQFVILNKSRIVAQADAGRGGNIRIVADQLLRSADSEIDASSSVGIDGLVVIDSPEADLAGNLVALPQAYVDAGVLLRERCGRRESGSQTGSFVAQPASYPIPGPDAPLQGSSHRVGLGDATAASTTGGFMIAEVIVPLENEAGRGATIVGCVRASPLGP